MPQIWGERGTKPGQFVQPRVVALSKGFAYIADTSGRVHKWTTSGKFIKAWTIPKPRNNSNEGPEGIAALKDGSLALTNTHAQKVIIYTPDGKTLRSWGTYGRQKGGFLLVTGICADPDGNIFTADYGGDFDRISKWTPQGKLLASWSGHGDKPRQFRRPCGLAISREGDLLVADTCNHRIQRLDRWTGKFKGFIGTPGRKDGQLHYPYGVAVDRQGFIYTVEFGAHRVQKWSPDGKFLTAWGGAGRAPGLLSNPWGIAVDDNQNIYVADTQNFRIQKFHF